MNYHYYECTIKFDKTSERGLIKKVTEKYLVSAVSFSDAETRLAKEMAPYMSGDFDITAIKRLAIADIFESPKMEADRWYNAKLSYITLDERTGEEKRTATVVYVRACDFDDARNVIQDSMKGTLGDWEKAMLRETAIVDIFR